MTQVLTRAPPARLAICLMALAVAVAVATGAVAQIAPPADDAPITMRHLMPHTPGFEETGKNIITSDPARVTSLEAGLKRWIPARVFPPGAVPACSNYGAALAEYIVERVSGEPFDA